jgi:hypothetical protein
MSRGWQEERTATGAAKRRLRSRGAASSQRDDCLYCQNQRKLLERFVDTMGKQYLMWVVCRYCEEKG